MARPKKPRQQTIEWTLGQPRTRRTQVQPVRPKPSRPQLPSSPLATKKPRGGSRRLIVDNDDVMDVEESVEDDGDDEEVPMPKRIKKRRQKQKQMATPKPRNSDDQPNDEEEDDDDATITPVSRSRKDGGPIIIIPSDDEDDDLPVLRVKTLKEANKTSSRKASFRDDDDSDDDIVSRPRQARTPGKRPRQSSSDDEEAMDRPVSQTRSSAPYTQSLTARIIPSSDTEEAELIAHTMNVMGGGNNHFSAGSSPTKRRRLVRPSQAMATSSPGRDLAATPGRTHRRPRTQKEKERDRLRKRRAARRGGITTDLPDDDDETDSSEIEGRKALYDSDSSGGFLVLREFDDDPESDLNGPSSNEQCENGQPRRQRKAIQENTGANLNDAIELDESGDDEVSSQGGKCEEDEENDDFIVEDDGTAYREAMSEIPIHLTRRGHKRLRDHFNLCVEWLVSLQLNPRAEDTRRDEDFLIAWDKMEQRVSGLASSKFSSAAWKEDFVNALRARPMIESFELLYSASGSLHEFEDCGACGRTNHPAKFRVQFKGPIYNKNTSRDKIDTFLETIEQDEEEGGEEFDENMRTVPPESREWYVGTVCHGNAEMVHLLTHWKHALLEWVEDRLRLDKVTERVGNLNRQSSDIRQGLVEEVMDGWRRDGTLGSLWGEFKDSIENAENQSVTGKKGKGKGRGGRY